MAKENIKVTVIIKPDIRNPFSKLVFGNIVLYAQYDQIAFSEDKHTKESIQRMLRNISHSQKMGFAISGEEIQLVHSLQRLFVSKITIDEIEIIAESYPEWFESLMKVANTIAKLRLPGTQMSTIFPSEDHKGKLIYNLWFNLSGGASLVSY